MPDLGLLVLIVVVLAVLFDFSNGFNDTANSIATVVSTRVMSPMAAVLMAATLNFAGAFFSTSVAHTIGRDIVEPGGVTMLTIVSALIIATLWNVVLTFFGLPISASHALIGGIIGAALVAHGADILNVGGIARILFALLISPLLGLAVGFFVMVLIYWLFHRTPPNRINKHFRGLQIFSAAFMAFSHGSNDAQKSMGIITLALFSTGAISSFIVPIWVIAICALAMAIGTITGGWKVIRTMGARIINLQPVHGFAAETSAALVILLASAVGAPVSTTHVIASSIMGVGASRRLSAVRWGVAGNIVLAWVFTLPLTALGAAAVYLLLNLFF
ncbi:MAG: inorganic phosphate transporter [bacterium]|nr:inorganic phosphate transporter [bacterium]